MLTPMRVLAVSAAALLVTGLAGCGGASSPGGSVSVTPSPGDGGTELTIAYDDGAGGTETWRLTCDPAGGNHPDPEAACAALRSGGETGLAPVPADAMCTELFGGPQTAKITGTWQGAPVEATLKRTNGCETARWTALAGMLPKV